MSSCLPYNIHFAEVTNHGQILQLSVPLKLKKGGIPILYMMYDMASVGISPFVILVHFSVTGVKSVMNPSIILTQISH